MFELLVLGLVVFVAFAAFALLGGLLKLIGLLVGGVFSLIGGLFAGIFGLLGGVLGLVFGAAALLLVVPVLAFALLPLMLPVLLLAGLVWLVVHAARKPAPATISHQA